MELKTKIDALSSKYESLKNRINTEEATKTAFVLPFINALGYDIFNPIEVVPEFTADVGLKKGEKVDYAVMHKGEPAIIFECKHWTEDLSNHIGQLFRYFSVAKAKFGVLTNGHEYRFYTDLVSKNVMDQKPFLSFDIQNIMDSTLNEVSKFHKSNFDEDVISTNATSLKYINEIKKIFKSELSESSPEFAKFFASKIVSGTMRAKVVTTFSKLIPTALKQIMNEEVNERLQKAITKESEKIEPTETVEESKIVTTKEELESFEIIKAILRKDIGIEKIHHRDTQSYFGVLYDNNNRKPICRLFLDGRIKKIELFDQNKTSRKTEINTIDNIYDFSEDLLTVANYYKNEDLK